MNKTATFKESFLKEFSFFMALPALIWQTLFFCVPLLFIVFMSLLAQTGLGLFTTEFYATFFKVQYAHILLRSLVLAFFTATASIFIAYPIAYYLVFYAKKFRNVMLFFLIVPFWTNILVQVYAWFFVLDTYGLVNSFLLSLGLIKTPLHLLNTPFALGIVMLYCYLPFMIMPIYSSLEKFDTRLFEASADLGASAWQTFLKITLPLSASGIRTGFFLVFVPSFGEYVIPALVAGGKQFYVGSLIAHFFLVMRDNRLGSAFTCIAGIVLALAGVIIFYAFKKLFNVGKKA